MTNKAGKSELHDTLESKGSFNEKMTCNARTILLPEDKQGLLRMHRAYAYTLTTMGQITTIKIDIIRSNYHAPLFTFHIRLHHLRQFRFPIAQSSTFPSTSHQAFIRLEGNDKSPTIGATRQNVIQHVMLRKSHLGRDTDVITSTRC